MRMPREHGLHALFRLAPHYRVSMDYGLSLIERDIAAHPDQFVLTSDGNLLVHFALGIEPSQRCSI